MSHETFPLIIRTAEEIEDFVGDVFSDGMHDITVSAVQCEGGWDILVDTMYDPVGVSFAKLMELSTFFGTKDIDVRETGSVPGCDTCDFGSKYEVTFEVREEER